MQIIIPMSGEGTRFKVAGYNVLKPLITVHGKSILEYVVNMFPGNHTFIFVCQEEHDKLYGLKSFISNICPNAK